MRRVPVHLAQLLILLAAGSAAAFTAPGAPTFYRAWGSLGTAAGQFNTPVGVALDARGDFYVVDRLNNRIEKFDRHGAFLLQWGSAGGGPGQFSSPGWVAVDPLGDVYVTDMLNHRVQKFSSTGIFLSQWGSAGMGDGQFSQPWGIAIDYAGNVYVTDGPNHRVQMFTMYGAYLTQWGSFGIGDGQFQFPLGVTTDSTGHVFVADRDNHRIQKFSSTGAYLAQWGSFGSNPGQFSSPAGVATDAVGNVYVADRDNSRVQKFSGGGVHLSDWAVGTGDGMVDNPRGIALDMTGNVYVAGSNRHRILEFSGAGATFADPGYGYLLAWGSPGGFPGQLNEPKAIAAEPSGTILVLDSARMQRFSATGDFIAQWTIPGLFDPCFFPTGVALDPLGNIFIVDTACREVYKFTSVMLPITRWGSYGTGPGQFVLPNGIAVSAAGDVYVTDFDGNRVQKFTAGGEYVLEWGTGGSGDGEFDGPWGIAVGPSGDVYVADSNHNRIQRFSSTGTYISQWGAPGSGDGQFAGPAAVAMDAAGNVLVADFSNHRVQKFTPDGVYLMQWGSFGTGDAQFTDPMGVTADPLGNLYVLDAGNGRVEKFYTYPSVARIADWPQDQGRRVLLRIERTSLDGPGSGVHILGYDVFLRSDPGTSASRAGARLGFEPVTTTSYLVPATGSSEYVVAVPTTVDATTASLQYSAFFVRAWAGPRSYFDSDLEYGYSVDNVAPPAPAPFTAAYAAGATHLHWDVSPAADFASFQLYRGTDAGFRPDPANLIATPADTGYADAGPAGRYYKITAKDRSGNEGEASLVGPGETLDVPAGAPPAFALEGPRPNPVRDGRMVAHFTLTAAMPARLTLTDVAGRRVAERAVGSLGPGRHAVDLVPDRRLAPGLYLLRLTQGTNVRVVRTVVLD